jgi:hypothetical protein
MAIWVSEFEVRDCAAAAAAREKISHLGYQPMPLSGKGIGCARPHRAAACVIVNLCLTWSLLCPDFGTSAGPAKTKWRALRMTELVQHP